jgi:hypothetical protein
MYDISMPQQGGMDEDGDAILLCHDPILINTKINKPVTVDIEDKVSTFKKPYTKENIIEYEMNSRDNRIGEITNIASSILNQYIKDDKWKKINEDNISLLRVQQGKEIDFQKTGVRWYLNKWMRRYSQRLPYFLLYRYPERLHKYNSIINKNKSNPDKKIPLNSYHSPSPLNELCDYIINWEKKKIVWDRSCYDTSLLILNNRLNLDDKIILKKIKHILYDFAFDWRQKLNSNINNDCSDIMLEDISNYYLNKLKEVIKDDRILLANYCIKAAYQNNFSNKSLVWYLFGDIILNNLKRNTPFNRYTKIIETQNYNSNAYEYLGKYYEMIEGDSI